MAVGCGLAVIGGHGFMGTMVIAGRGTAATRADTMTATMVETMVGIGVGIVAAIMVEAMTEISVDTDTTKD
jgi:hypothetical protein